MNRKNTQKGIKQVAVIAMFCALAYACMLVVKIPVQFLTLDIKDSLIILCGLIFGPLTAVVVSFMVPFLEFVTISGTGVYGLVMNVLSSLSFSLTASLIYRYKKTFYGAISGLASGILAMTAIMMLANLFITPYYMGVPTATVAALIPKLLLPFNLIKAVLNAAIVLLFYKPISNILKRSGLLEAPQSDVVKNTSSKARNIWVTVIALIIIAVSFAIIFLVLKS
ncbi:MAG: ECF transporter S component [Clostridia bacterium]|nr:ECF transporter S component [Clostridia bacterium]MBO7250358.1 ECF transporter S component [Clostridia bacterium]